MSHRLERAASRSAPLRIARGIGLLIALLSPISVQAQWCFPDPPAFPLAPLPLEVTVAFPAHQLDMWMVVTDQVVADWIWQITQGWCPPLGVAGTVATGNGGYNAGWSWHLESDSIFLWEFITEICDYPPYLIEQELGGWVGATYCPWGGIIAAAEPASYLPADITVDGAVDADDLAVMDSCLGTPESECWNVAAGCCAADLDGDRHATCADWEILDAAWTDPVDPQVPAACAAPVPALAPAGLAALAVLLVFARRQQFIHAAGRS
jgi:hypothetical protein